MNPGDQIAQEILSDYEMLAADRATLDSHCVEIADRVMPGQRHSFNGGNPQNPQGGKNLDLVFDSTASINLGRFASIFESILTPRTQTWHRLQVSDDYLRKNREVQLYYEDVNRILFKERYLPNANFSSQNQRQYRSLGAFGTGAMFIDELFGVKGLRYKNVQLGEIYLAENHQGIVDKVIRRFALTVRQATQKFGDNLPEEIKKKTNLNEKCIFLHCVKPRMDINPLRGDYKGMPFASYYVAEQGKKLLLEGGYNTFPYAVSRYVQDDNEVYGRSPIMDVLPAIKTLNEQKKTVLKQGHRTVDPVLLAHDDGIIDSFSLRPGAINAGGVSADGRALVHALPVGNIAIGKELMDDEKADIKDALLVTMFQILIENPQMTATEVLERAKEKGMLLAPTFGRQESEYLGPMIERELDILARQNRLPPMPGILKEAQGEYTVIYDSPLSRSQKAEEAAGVMRSVETALNVVNITQNPEPLDHFNWDVIIPEISHIQGVPARFMRGPKEIIEIRAGRQNQQETQEMIQAAPAAAALKKADVAAQKGK